MPDGYDGIALREMDSGENRDTGTHLPIAEAVERCDEEPHENKNPWEGEKDIAASARESDGDGGGGILSSLPFIRGIFDAKKIPFLSSVKIPRIGLEEILIIGAALLMLFSKSGDIECAIILGLLLFVS